ncbi:hypothetical protein BGZ83_004977, partial [Gryganskiella cystojenkinii]
MILDHSRGQAHIHGDSAAFAVASPGQEPACDNKAQLPCPVIGDEYLDEEDDEFGDEDDGYREVAEVEAMDKGKTPDTDDDEATKRKKARKEEPTSKHLRGLEVVICQLIDDAASWEEVTMATLEKTLHERDKYTMDQKNVAIKIVNMLRLFAPRKDPNGKVPHHILA